MSYWFERPEFLRSADRVADALAADAARFAERFGGDGWAFRCGAWKEHYRALQSAYAACLDALRESGRPSLTVVRGAKPSACGYCRRPGPAAVCADCSERLGELHTRDPLV